jgi:hypothetical protein
LEQRVSGQANAPQEGQTVQGGSLGGARRADGSGLWPGQLLVPKRFPLTRLRILSEAESLREDALILQYFGLKKTGPLQPWIYRDSDRSPVRILSLAEVAALPPSQMREPDFLELLKAAIVPGALVSVAGASASPNSTDALLVQIFANLVDQCDGDGYPTQILFWDASSDSKARVFSGVEHLPYLHRVRSCVSMNRQSVPPSPFVSAEPVETGSLFSRPPASDPGSAWVWQDLGLWNPHVVSGSFAAAGPTRFRVVAQTPVAFGLRAVQTQSMVFEDTRLPGRAVDLAASDVVLEGEQIRFSIARAGLSALSRPVFISEACTARWIQVERGEQSRFPVDGALDAAGFGIVGIGVAEVPRVYNAQVQVGDSVRRFSVFPSHYEAEGVGEPSEPAKIRYTLEYQAPGSEQAPVWISYDQKMAVPFRAAVWAEGFAGGAVGATGVPEPWEFSDPRHHGVEVPEYAGGPHFPLFFFNRFGEFGVRVDADGVVRRASGAYAAGGSPGSTAAGLDRFALLTPEQLPVVINRPFRSVAEMAYAWSGMPWKQLDFSTPESGFAGLLDVFCVGENDHPLGIEAGRVNLNTRHPEVLEALLSGTRLDEAVPAGVLSTGSLGSARKLAEALVARTLSTDPSRGPLENVRDLVGSWRPSQSGTAAAMGTLNGSVVYQGFSADLPGALSGADRVLRSERARTAPIRALADAGQTRVWNLLVDIVVQTGRYPRSQPGSRVSGGRVMGPRERQAALESELEKFVIDAQQRFWWHLAVDRLTGAVVDEAVELVDF